jgi:hypothetical protein
MNDLISKEAVLKIIDNETQNTSDYLQHNTQINIRFAVDELPTVEPVRGEWEVATQKGVYTWSKGYARCSACEETVWGGWDMNFCPNCGARMVKDNE